MLKSELTEIVDIYLKARDDFSKLVGECPENYKVLVFINPVLHVSLNRVLETAGTPQAILSAEYINHLKSARYSDFLPIGRETLFDSFPTLIYLSVPSYELTEEQSFALRVMLVHAFAHAYLNEKTRSNSPKILAKLYQIDVILKELMANNVYKLTRDEYRKSHAWAWQYYQDLIAVIRLFTECGIEDFYTPVEEARKYTLFNNFIIEAISLLKERAKLAKKKNLLELVTEGFAFYVQQKELEYLKNIEAYNIDAYPKELKPYMAPPIGKFSFDLVNKVVKNYSNEKEFFDKIFTYYSDLELLKELSWDEIKELLSTSKNSHSESVVETWHTSKSRWTDVWSVYAYGWRIIEEYVRKVYRRNYINFGQLLSDKPKVLSKGYVKVGPRKVYVFEINDHGVGLDQLVILHNHMALYRDEFSTILPAFADIIAFKKIGGLHIATLFAVDRTNRTPLSPYNLAVITRAVHVSRRKDAYRSELDEEKTRKLVSQIDYSYLKKLTQPQRMAIEYLIKEGMYEL